MNDELKELTQKIAHLHELKERTFFVLSEENDETTGMHFAGNVDCLAGAFYGLIKKEFSDDEDKHPSPNVTDAIMSAINALVQDESDEGSLCREVLESILEGTFEEDYAPSDDDSPLCEGCEECEDLIKCLDERLAKMGYEIRKKHEPKKRPNTKKDNGGE